jgi:hypothetical protein
LIFTTLYRSGSQQWNAALPQLLRVCCELSASAGGVTFLDLLDCVALHQPVNGAVAGASSSQLVSLDLSYNHFLSYCDSPWELLAIPPDLAAELQALVAGSSPAGSHKGEDEPGSEPMDLDIVDITSPQRVEKHRTRHVDPAEVFLVWLLSSFPQLQTLSLSHCAATEAQAATLCLALDRALQAREGKGLPALHSLVVQGLLYLNPVQVGILLQSIARSRTYSTTIVDTGGYCFAL